MMPSWRAAAPVERVKSPPVRVALLTILGRSLQNDRARWGLFVRALNDPDGEVRRTALEAMLNEKNREQGMEEIRRAAYRHDEWAGGPALVIARLFELHKVLELIRQGGTSARRLGLAGLVHRFHPTVENRDLHRVWEDDLKHALADPDIRVRRAVAEALASLYGEMDSINQRLLRRPG